MAKLTAKAVPHSSVVGGSVAIHDAKGAVVALIMVSVPDPGRDYKATAPTYWDDLHQRAEGPEECAAADMSYWGE